MRTSVLIRESFNTKTLKRNRIEQEVVSSTVSLLYV